MSIDVKQLSALYHKSICLVAHYFDLEKFFDMSIFLNLSENFRKAIQELEGD